MHPVGAGVLDALSHNGAPLQIGSGAEDGCPHLVHGPGAQHHLPHPARLRPQVDDLPLAYGQVLLPFQGVLHHLLVFPPVRLGPQGVDGWALAPVEHPVLDAGRIRRPAHLAAQSVQLPDQVALAGAADGRVAGHIAHGVQIDGEDNGLQSHPRRRQSRLDAGMARADDGNIKFSSRKFFHGKSSIVL